MLFEYLENIDTKDLKELLQEIDISEREIGFLGGLLQQGKELEVFDIIIQKYFYELFEVYTREVRWALDIAQRGQLPEKNLSKLLAFIGVLSLAFSRVLIDSLGKVLEKSIAPFVFSKANIQMAKTRKAILNEVLTKFETLTQGAMSQTQANVLNYIREMQRRFIIKNQSIKNKKFTKEQFQKELESFKKELKSTFPQYYKAMEEGKFLSSRRFGEKGEKVLYYKLDNYLEMSLRTTFLNIERTAIEAAAIIEDVPVVEYYLKDDRPLKTGVEREICKEILAVHILGKPLLATTEEAGKLLGIMTVEEARTTPDYALGPYCRHSIRIPSKTYLRKIRAILKQEKLAAYA